MNMRSFSILILSILVVLPLAAQPVQPLHQATPVDQLLKEFWAKHPEMMHDHAHHDAQLVAEMEPMQKVSESVTANATKSFTVVASSFTFTITPSPFVVNQGDTVTLDVTSSSGDTTHGFFLEQYFTAGTTLIKGQHHTVTFVANTPGSFSYVCTVPSCGTGHNNMFGVLVVNAAATPPSISSFTPRTGSTSGGTVVAISGTNFQNGATVKFGDASAISVTVNSATSINAMSPVHAAGDVSLTVTNPDGQSATAGSFTYTVPGPSVASVSPSSGSNAGGTPITISGSNFVSPTVTIGGLPAVISTVTASTIFASTPAGPFDFAGSASRDVTVTNQDGHSATLTNGFTYTLPAPSITGISPNGSSPTGGNSVVITGTGFSSGVAITVRFGGVAGTGVQVTSPTSLTVTAPAHAAGTVDVVVTVGSASATSAGSFTYQTPGKKRRAVGVH
jgi:plastocyanin